MAKSNKWGVAGLCHATKGALVFLAFAPLGGVGVRQGKRSLSGLASAWAALQAVGDVHGGVSPHVVALAWLRAKFPGTCIPLVGMRSARHLGDLALAGELQLTAEEVAKIEKAA